MKLPSVTLPRSLVATSLALLTACSEGTSGPGPHTTPRPGVVSLLLVTPNADDGAVLLKVSGGPIDSVASGAVSMRSAAGIDGATILATGAVQNGVVLARLWLPDITKVAQYSARVVQAAARTTYAQQNVQNYRGMITR
jgi:hypothetical protein